MGRIVVEGQAHSFAAGHILGHMALYMFQKSEELLAPAPGAALFKHLARSSPALAPLLSAGLYQERGIVPAETE